MITGNLGIVLRTMLPMVFRRCPMGNTHVRSEEVCICCTGNEFKCVNGKWVPLKYAPLTDNGKASSLSMSGQLSSSDLWLGALKQGLVIAIVVIMILSYCLFQAKIAADTAADNMQQKQTQEQE